MTDNLLTPETEPNQDQKKPELLPDKFWDAANGRIRLDALIGSYLALEKKLSSVTSGAETQDGHDRQPKSLGVPETPDDYMLNISHGLFTSDAEVNQRLHRLGFTTAQVQAVYDLAAEKLVPLVIELSEEFKADREVERLVAAFGGPERWAEMSRQLLAFGRKNFPADVLANLASSFEGVMALHRMMEGGDAPGLSRGAGKPDGVSESDLQGMMRDPRYWKEKDPSFVGKVTDGFKRIYGN